MDFKTGVRVALFAFLSMITVQTHATYCSGKATYSLPRQSNLHSYLDLGFEQTIHSNLSSANYRSYIDERDYIFATKKIFGNNLFLEAGWLWSELLTKDSPYFPYLNLGIQYSHSSGLHTLMEYKTEVVHKKKEGGNFEVFSEKNFDFSSQSLLAHLKLALYRWHRVIPYLHLGLGSTWHQVKSQKVDWKYNIALKFNEVKQRTFTYQAGIGLDFPITDYFWLSLSYQSQHMGNIFFKYKPVALNEKGVDNFKEIKAELKEAGLTLNDLFKPFHFNDLNTQTIQLTARYVFG